MRQKALSFILALVVVVLGACESTQPLQGERISVFDLEKKLKVAGKSNKLKIVLPKAKGNRDWGQVGISAAHTPQHLVFGKGAKENMRFQAGSKGGVPFSAAPIVAQGKIFVLDGEGQVRAFDIKTGKTLWRQDFYLEDSFGGGLAYDSGKIFIATGGGTIAALASSNGDIVWRHEVGLAFRAAPVVWQGKVFFMSFSNMLTVRDAFSGKELWNHSGISESSSLLMPSAVTVANNIVIVPYNSGEVFALNANNKQFIWTDNLLRQGIGAATGSAGFIAVPAIDRNIIYMISNADYAVAINLRNGARLWSQHVSGLNMPWVAGEQVYILSQKGVLLCLSRAKGLILWRAPLTKAQEAVVWFGPVLASGSLWLTSSDGRLAEVSARSGKVMSVRAVSDGFRVAPIIAAGRMFLLSSDMELIQLQPNS